MNMSSSLRIINSDILYSRYKQLELENLKKEIRKEIRDEIIEEIREEIYLELNVKIARMEEKIKMLTDLIERNIIIEVE